MIKEIKKSFFKEIECIRCKNSFMSNPLIEGDDVCPTCERMNDITFWYPRLYHLNFPMPKTIIIHTNVDLEKCDFSEYEKEPEGFDKFLKEIEEASKSIGLPVFLKTGYTSNKHDWKESCFIDNLKNLKSHIYNLIGFSLTATIDRFMPCDFWAIREIIKTKPYFTYFSGEMPITKERRIFIRNGKAECSHSYWQSDIFKGEIEKNKFKQLDKLTENDMKELFQMAQYVANIFQGYWSCDFLQAENGKWYLTDMAIGERSYHQAHN